MTVAFIQRSSTGLCKERRVALKTVHRYYQPISIHLLMCPSLIEHFLCLSNPAFILLANGHHSAYIRYSASKAWKNTQQDEIYALSLCYKSLLHGQSKASKS